MKWLTWNENSALQLVILSSEKALSQDKSYLCTEAWSLLRSKVLY